MKTFEDPSPVPRGSGLSVATAWTDAPCPIVVVDSYGVVVDRSSMAAAILPEAAAGVPLEDAAPDWLAAGHRRVDGTRGRAMEPVDGLIGERSFAAHPTVSGDGCVVWWLMEDTDRRRSDEALADERRRTAFLAQASGELLASLNVDRCMEVAARLAALHLADAAVVVLLEGGRGLPMAASVAGDTVTRGSVDADPYGMPGLGEALQGFPPVPSRWIDPAAVPDWLLPAGFTGPVGSVAVVSLPGHGTPTGALVLLRRGGLPGFSESEEAFFRLYASRVGAVLSVARKYTEQAAITDALLNELLPPRLEQVHGVDFAGGYRGSGMSERIGGDFYDVHPGAGKDLETFAVLGDVCGKGLEAAAYSGKIRNILHALLLLTDDHQHILELLNGVLLTSHDSRFVTLVLASAVRLDTAVRLRLTSAGHAPPLIVRADGRVEEVRTSGTLIGVLSEIQSTSVTEYLAPGETCLLYTDGITEARGGPLGGEEFGEERLKAALSECAAMPAEAVAERIQMVAAQWVGDGLHDDMSVLAITAPRAVHPATVRDRTPGRCPA